MTRKAISRVALAFALLAVMGAPTWADFYDDFEDGWYERDSNDPLYDPSDPNWTDPNNRVWKDIDNPDWDIYVPLGTSAAATAQDGWLRLWSADAFSPWALTVAYVESGDKDPNTSPTYWDDASSHYVLARTKNYDDPNRHRGRSVLFLNANELTWNGGYELSYEHYKSPNRLWGITCITGMWWTNISSTWVTPRDEQTGFWMLFQFVSDGVAGDPNNKYLRAASWDGDKYDWDGTWEQNSNVHLGADPNTFDDPNAALFYENMGGRTAVCSYGDAYWHPDGYPSDIGFDGIEGRTGEFDPDPKGLDLTVSHPENGYVTVDPDGQYMRDANDPFDPNPFDPNTFDPNTFDPNDPNTYPEARQWRYTTGTEVVMVAHPWPGGKGFNKWEVTDPVDANNSFADTNAVLYLTMDRDWEVKAKFACGSAALMPMIGLSLAFLGAVALVRRFGR